MAGHEAVKNGDYESLRRVLVRLKGNGDTARATELARLALDKLGTVPEPTRTEAHDRQASDMIHFVLALLRDKASRCPAQYAKHREHPGREQAEANLRDKSITGMLRG